VRVRIKATANVAKLTGVMKMVASAKARAAEDALIRGRPFGVSGIKSRWRASAQLAGLQCAELLAVQQRSN
jgi:F0F1-type ATP synthase gamma subunit